MRVALRALAIAFGPYVAGYLFLLLFDRQDEGANILGGLVLGALLILGMVLVVVYVAVSRKRQRR
jgi:hypothetical protein